MAAPDTLRVSNMLDRELLQAVLGHVGVPRSAIHQPLHRARQAHADLLRQLPRILALHRIQEVSQAREDFSRPSPRVNSPAQRAQNTAKSSAHSANSCSDMGKVPCNSIERTHDDTEPASDTRLSY
ncbi:hypothetical protein CMK11_06120 [Candidatus Poribacteria bacterium]|nr:hypothetical protein [Candidatus Poribacteria bacterium]